MNDRNSMEVRFVELMSQLFQLDEAERLIFGIYRIIRRHNHEVKAFLGEVAREGGKAGCPWKFWQGCKRAVQT